VDSIQAAGEQPLATQEDLLRKSRSSSPESALLRRMTCGHNSRDSTPQRRVSDEEIDFNVNAELRPPRR
jgi:hypothetical protein